MLLRLTQAVPGCQAASRLILKPLAPLLARQPPIVGALGDTQVLEYLTLWKRGRSYPGQDRRLLGRALQQFPQDAGGSASGKLLQYVLGYGKDGPVVGLQDVFPGRQYLTLGVCNIGAAHQPQRFHPLVHPCNALVEDHGVSDDGAGHAAGLGNVAHSQQPGNDRGEIGAQIRHFRQTGGGLPNALLKRVSRLLYCFLWDGHQPGYVSQIAY